MIVMIAAAAENNALGKDNQLLWHLPDDFKRFKALTTGHYIIMGRKTFESFPKPLPNRTHVIITRQNNYQYEGCIVADSIEQAMAAVPKNETAFLIGGGEIYQATAALWDKVYLTEVDIEPEGDVFFPALVPSEWREIWSEAHAPDEKNKFAYTYRILERIAGKRPEKG